MRVYYRRAGTTYHVDHDCWSLGRRRPGYEDGRSPMFSRDTKVADDGTITNPTWTAAQHETKRLSPCRVCVTKEHTPAGGAGGLAPLAFGRNTR